MAFYCISFDQQRGRQSIDLKPINTAHVRFKNIVREVQ